MERSSSCNCRGGGNGIETFVYLAFLVAILDLLLDVFNITLGRSLRSVETLNANIKWQHQIELSVSEECQVN